MDFPPPLSPRTPSLPGARPRSRRSRCGGRKSKFLAVTSGAMAAFNPIRFSTKYVDLETGDLYYGYRYLTASIGRWLSKDPMEEAGGPNLYAYVGNRGLSAGDAFGLDWIEYTGLRITYYSGSTGDRSHAVSTGPADSGLPWSQATSRCQTENGPLPPGRYKINLGPNPDRFASVLDTGELASGQGVQQIPSSGTTPDGRTFTYPGWGTWRARLTPIGSTSTTGRPSPNFYLHNSVKGYSHGCVETPDKFRDLLKSYRSSGNRSIEVRVNYSDGPVTGPYPPPPFIFIPPP